MISQKGLPERLYRAEQVRELDRCAIDEFSIPGITLMRRAGQFTFDQLLARWPDALKLSIWCGGGNNGGDGYIVAGLAQQRGIAVQLVTLADESELKGDAALACQWAKGCGVVFTPYSDGVQVAGDVIVDALLGTGLDNEVRGPFDSAIAHINRSDVPVAAVDVPSGLNSDSGAVMGDAVWAELTITFIGLKRGQFTGKGSVCCGDIVFDGLDVPVEVYERVAAQVVRFGGENLAAAFPPRQRDAHKGHFGHVLVVGGNAGFGGAAIMAAQAAGRVGAGLVSVATRPEHVPALLARCPEIMAHGVNDGKELRALLAGKDVIVVGPGLGQDIWSRQLLEQVLATDITLVVDADALNLLASMGGSQDRRDSWILTPHPGEAAKLLQSTVAEVQADRFAAVQVLQECYGGVAILKGNGTLVAGSAEQPMALCTSGNPGMASGGMGDVLSGVLGGLLAQGFELEEAARLGAVLHGEAADLAAEAGERGMLATDLLPHLRYLVNPLV